MLEAVSQEAKRRLALGFDYDFGDARGIHHIGTTDKDMKGWDEVSAGTCALRDAGEPAAEISIVTDTGPAVVTAAEWARIRAAIFNAGQPIYAASFALQAMDPLPQDFTDDRWWP